VFTEFYRLIEEFDLTRGAQKIAIILVRPASSMCYNSHSTGKRRNEIFAHVDSKWDLLMSCPIE